MKIRHPRLICTRRLQRSVGTFEHIETIGRARSRNAIEAILRRRPVRGDLYNAVGSVALNVQRSGANLILNWPRGTLQEANSITGRWSNVNGAAAPSHNVAPTGSQKFYRVNVSP